MFYFIYLVEWRCCVDRTVPEAIHNLVAIKLPVSDLLTLHIQVCYVYLFLNHDRFFIYIFLVPC